jgi:hypothetical protein
MGSTFQNLRSPFSVSVFAAVPSQVWNHGGLFWDPEYLTYVRGHLSEKPWSVAWQQLLEAANWSLTVVPQPIRGPWYVPMFYEDTSGRNRAILPLDESAAAMLWSANAYLISRETKYALKVVEIADAWTGSLMLINSQQATYEAHWYLQTMAVAAEMINQFRGWNHSKRQAFIDWQVERANYLIRAGTSDNNHSYWLACQAMVVGTLAENGELFDYAVRVFKGAIEHDIALDGHMPKETARGSFGIHYQNFAIEPLTFLAEMARRQGVNLYSYQSGKVSLKLAIDYFFKYYERPREWPWDSTKQVVSGIPQHFGWLEFAYYEWHSPTYLKWLQRDRPIFDRWCGGVTTLTHGLPSEDDVGRLLVMAEDSVEIAASQSRTQGLDEAKSLIQHASDALKSGNYTGAIDLALLAEEAAERATKPMSVVSVETKTTSGQTTGSEMRTDATLASMTTVLVIIGIVIGVVVIVRKQNTRPS